MTLSQKIRELDMLASTEAGLDKHPISRNEKEAELANIVCGLRMMLSIITAEGNADDDFRDAVTEYEERIKRLL